VNLLLDSYAYLELLSDSTKSKKVQELVTASEKVFTTVLNLYEVRYRVTQKTSEKTADAYIESIKTTGHVIPVTEDIVSSASEVKLKHPKMGAVDCITLATARRQNLTVVTGDADFPKSKDVILL
jgi:predicted nucleic acid-binding protein